MVDCAVYQDQDLEERQAWALKALREYFQVVEGDKDFSWTFADGRYGGRIETSALEEWAKGWKSVAERETWNRMTKEANSSLFCMSTNHMLMVSAIRDEATPFEIMQGA